MDLDIVSQFSDLKNSKFGMLRMTSHLSSRAWGRHTCKDVAKDVKAQQNLNLNLVAISVAMGLSRKPCGGFPWFFACKSGWMSQVRIAKIITIGPIPVDLEGFSITMATVSNFSKNNIRKDALWSQSFACAKFQPDILRNGREDEQHRHKYLVYL